LGERRLLADDGRQVGGERQEERLDLPPLGVSRRPIRDAVVAGPVEAFLETDPMGEA
jgi:hypothetical protein